MSDARASVEWIQTVDVVDDRLVGLGYTATFPNHSHVLAMTNDGTTASFDTLEEACAWLETTGAPLDCGPSPFFVTGSK